VQLNLTGLDFVTTYNYSLCLIYGTHSGCTTGLDFTTDAKQPPSSATYIAYDITKYQASLGGTFSLVIMKT